jgi:hypothetical protein
MTENPYAIPLEDLVDSARVPLPAQVEEQAEQRFPVGDPSGHPLWADGMSGDADGE